MGIEIRIEDHSEDILRALEEKKEAVLEAWGQQGVSYVKNEITAAGRRDTGNLVNSFSHQVKEDEGAVYVGSPVSYAYFHEMGTGAYHDDSDGKQGRKGWWVYVPGDETHQVGNGKIYTKAEALRIMHALRNEGLDAHITQGVKPVHMVKNGIGDHVEQFKGIAETILKK